uniref:Uncharacterized protein n=2 Tax=Aegilops tauschii TaxID=37682 RepID=A0A453GYH6_AEGTS
VRLLSRTDVFISAHGAMHSAMHAWFSDLFLIWYGEKARLLSRTDVFISAHGAQMTNLVFMDQNSSIMEFYPMGWRRRAAGGQFVYRWMASRAGMRHEGSWWDPTGDPIGEGATRARSGN